MKQLITLVLALCSMAAVAQTQTAPPPGSKPYGTPVAVPDGRLMVGKTGSYTFIPTKSYTDSLIALGWTKTQVDSAIVDQVGRINFPVTSVQGMTGEISLAPADLGLGNVDNTSDADKPISTATQSALDGKENAFGKGSLVAGLGVTLDGTLSNRLVGSGNVTVNADLTDYMPRQSTLVSDFNALSNTRRRVTLYSTTFAPANAPSGSNYFVGIDLNHHLAGEYKATLAIGTAGTIKYSWKTTSTNYAPWVTVWDSNNFTPPSVFTRSVNGLVPSPGSDTGTKRYLDDSGSWTVPAGGGGSTPTDLSIQNRTSTTLQIGSSTGSSATIPAATASLGGLLTATQFNQLTSLPSDAYSQIQSDARFILKTGDEMSGNLAITTAAGGEISLNRPDVIGDVGVINFRVAGIPRATINAERHTAAGQLTDLVFKTMGGERMRINNAGLISTPSYGNSAIWNDKSWASISGKPTTFVPSPHSHSASDINSGTLAIARIPTGTTGSTVALGNHTHPFSAITGKPTTLSGYGITDAVPSSRTINSKALSSNVTLTASDVSAVPLSGNATISGIKTFSSPVVVAAATSSNHAVTLAQVNALVPERPDWTQYSIPWTIQGRRSGLDPATGYYYIGGLTYAVTQARHLANVLDGSFVNDGDAAQITSSVEMTVGNYGSIVLEISGIEVELPILNVSTPVGNLIRFDIDVTMIKKGASLYITSKISGNSGAFDGDSRNIQRFQYNTIPQPASNLLIRMRTNGNPNNFTNYITIGNTFVNYRQGKYIDD